MRIPSTRILRVSALLVLAGASASGRQGSDPLFPTPYYKVDGGGTGNASDTELADLDGDGLLDHATAMESPGHVALSFGNGDGTFAPPVHIPAGPNAFDVEVVDLDEDGDLDLVVGCLSQPTGLSTVAVLRNNGSGGFAPAVQTPVGDYGARLFVADFDLDGDADVLTMLLETGARLLRGTGAGAFTPSEVTSIGPSYPATVADVDGDSDPDVIADVGIGTGILLYRNDGSGSFGAPEATPLPSWTEALTAADVDADGDADLVWATQDIASTETLLGVIWNDGTGAFTPAPLQSPGIPVQVDDQEPFQQADLDGDGNLDLVVTLLLDEGVAPAPALALLHGDGAGSFAATVHSLGISLAAFASQGVSLGELDGDGALDAVVMTAGKSLVVFAGDGAGGFTAALPAAQVAEPVHGALADLDGDGYLDLLATSSTASVASALGDGDGGFGAAQMHSVASVPFAVEPVDWDGDLDVDVLAVGTQGTVELLRGDGAGGLALAASKALGSVVRDVVSGDFDGDGAPDLVVMLASGSVRLEPDSGGGFSAPAPVDLCFGGPCTFLPTGFDAGDVDVDGVLDLVVAKSVALSFGLVDAMFGDGAGGFPTGESSPFVGADVALGDLDDDGLLDLLVQGNTFRTAKGDGQGNFALMASYTPLLAGPNHRVVLRDLNADGLLDALGSTGEVRLGNGTGALEYQGTYAWPYSFSVMFPGQVGPEALVADVDADGLPDVVTFDLHHDFVYVSPDTTGCSGELAAYGFGCAGSGGFAPALSIEGCAATGGTVRARIDGALGGAPALLVMGPSMAHLPLPNGCELLVAPIIATLGFTLSGSVPGAGAQELTTTLGAAPPGALVALQALILDPAAPAFFTSTNGVRLVLE